MLERKTPTQERVCELFTYDPESGILRWKSRRGPVKPGDEAGWRTTNCKNKKTYLQVSVDYRTFFVHRVIFLIVTGSMPDEVDHKDGDGENNAWLNLRPVRRSENSKNRRRYAVNTSGSTGVCWVKRYRTWESYIYLNGRKKSLGTFKNKQDAVSRRKAAEVEFGFHVNHGSDRPL